MRTAFIAGLLLVSASVSGYAEEPSRFHVSGAAGLQLGGSAEALTLAAGFGYSLNRHFSVGADFSYSYLPLAAQARGGGNRAYWGLATLTATAAPSAKVSPYVVLGYGLGHYDASSGKGEFGNSWALGAGLRVRLSDRASLFVDARLAIMGGITAADGLHAELPVSIGVRFGL